MDVKFHLVDPDENGRHPERPELVMFEAEPYNSMYIVTTPAEPAGSMLVSEDEWLAMVGSRDQADLEFAYCSDEYLDLLRVTH